MWNEGDCCLAPYPRDNKLYSAKICTLITKKEGNQLAIVHYDGYESEDNEIFDVQKLKKIKEKPGPQKTKNIVAIGGHAKINCTQLMKTESKEIIDVAHNSANRSESFVLASTSKTSNINGFDGFSEEDLLKPNFPQNLFHKKEPYILSKENELPVTEIPAVINQYLRDYQRDGVKFLYDHYRRSLGAILGDDMGLGKTVQIIAFLAALLQKTGTSKDLQRQQPRFIQELSKSKLNKSNVLEKTFLIIVPASVLYNWLDELDTWGHFSISKFYKSERDETMKKARQGKLDIVLTTFETAREHMDQLNSFGWDAVIVDEAHKIKECKAGVTKALKSLKVKCRYGLTGTAVQNNMKELWCLLDWANPNCLGTMKTFEESFITVIECGQRHDATKRELAIARKKKEEFAHLRKRWMIRRTKSIIADQLPRKDDLVIFCKLTKFQLDIYKAILAQEDVDLVVRQWEPCSCASGHKRRHCCYKENKKRQSVNSLTFTYLSILLKAANHVALLLPDATESKKQQMAARPICDRIFARYPEFVQNSKEASFRTLSDPIYCGKMEILTGLLDVFKKEGSKVLLFSYSTKLLDILEQYVISRGFEYRRLDGKTKTEIRFQLVHDFNHDRHLFLCLVSTKAGGLGLNFTGANVVVIFDPNWNPSHDLQAQDRAYRIGQRRNVRVYRLISAGTIEENIYLRQIYKQQLDHISVETENARRYFHGVQGDPQNKGELFGIQNLFGLRSGDTCLTYDILQRNSKLEDGLVGFQVTKYIPPTTQPDEATEEILESVCNNEESDEVTYNLEFLSEQLLFDENPSESAEKMSTLPSKKDANTTVRTVEVKKTKYLECHTVSSSDSEGSINEILSSDKNMPKNGQKIKTNSNARKHMKISGEISVNDVLKSCGVIHTHANKDVVGKSKAEDHMTRCAIRDVYELNQFSQIPAVNCDPIELEESVPEDVSPSPSDIAKYSLSESKPPVWTPMVSVSQPRWIKIKNYNVIHGGTPKMIRRQHFDKLADSLDLSVQELAKKIISSSTLEHSTLLKDYYTKEDPDLNELFETLEKETNPLIIVEKKHSNSLRFSKKKKSETSDQAMKRKPIKNKVTLQNTSTVVPPPNDLSSTEASTSLCMETTTSNSKYNLELLNKKTRLDYVESISKNNSPQDQHRTIKTVDSQLIINPECCNNSQFDKQSVSLIDHFMMPNSRKMFVDLGPMKTKPSFSFLNDLI